MENKPLKVKNNYGNKTDFVCDALIEAFNERRIQIKISGDKYENSLSLKVYIDGRIVLNEYGILY